MLRLIDRLLDWFRSYQTPDGDLSLPEVYRRLIGPNHPRYTYTQAGDPDRHRLN